MQVLVKISKRIRDYHFQPLGIVEFRALPVKTSHDYLDKDGVLTLDQAVAISKAVEEGEVVGDFEEFRWVRYDVAEVSDSLREFWLNLRTAARLLTPTATSDSPQLSSATLESMLRRAVIWLTPKAVESFRPDDFGFLDPRDLRALAEGVQKFRAVARQVDPGKPAADSEIEQALVPFRRVLEILRPDNYADPEALILGHSIDRQLPDALRSAVAELRFETGPDSTGDPALWIWVILKDEATATDDLLLAHARTIREAIERIVFDLHIERWPYVRFRSESELESFEKQRVR
jgi:hypothetical protein